LRDYITTLMNSRGSSNFFRPLSLIFTSEEWPSTVFLLVFLLINPLALVELLKEIGRRLLETDSTTTEIMFESLVLPIMVDVIKEYYNKREQVSQIIFSYCLVSSSSRQRFLKKIKEHLSQNLKLFIAILSVVVSFYSEEDFTEDLFNLYFYYAIVALDFPSPVTRAQGLKILNEIVYINYIPVIQIIGKILIEVFLDIFKRKIGEFSKRSMVGSQGFDLDSLQ